VNRQQKLKRSANFS